LRRVWALLVLLLVAALAAGDLESALRRAEELSRAKAREAQALQAEIARLDRESRRLRERLAELQAAITRLTREIDALDRRIALLTEEVAELGRDERQKAARLEELKTRLKVLMRRLWRERSGKYLPVLRAGSFTELAVRSRWLAALGRADLELAQATLAAKEELARTRAKKEALVRALVQDREERARKARELELARRKLAAALAELKRNRQAKVIRLDSVRQSQRELEAEITRLKRELERARLSKLPKSFNSRLRFPVDGGRILLRYGQNGEDFEWIQAPSPAAPVRAAADGRVFAVLYYGNVGWMVMIQHSRDFFTQYVNLQRPEVEVGDRVERGEVIGRLGGAVLISPDVLWFRVAVWKNGRFYYISPDPYY